MGVVILSVALNPSIDKLVMVERVVPGKIHRPSSVTAVAGGKGFNAARAAKSLGSDVRAVGIVGGHAGRWVIDAMAQEGIQVTACWCSAETRASLSVYSVDEGTLTEFYEPGQPVTVDEWERFHKAAQDAVCGAGWVTVSGSLPRGVPVSSVADIIGMCKKSGAAVAVDLRGPVLAAAFSGQPDLVKVNLAEASEALGRPVPEELFNMRAPELPVVEGEEPAQESVVEELAACLREASRARVAVITCGLNGAVMCDKRGTWVGSGGRAGGYPVGSGDAFLGAMVSELESSGDWVEAFRLGLGAGVANAAIPGAGRFDPEEARAMARSASIRTKKVRR